MNTLEDGKPPVIIYGLPYGGFVVREAAPGTMMYSRDLIACTTIDEVLTYLSCYFFPTHIEET